MSRMLAFAAAHESTWSDAVGRGVLADFAALSVLHADGWGLAWHDALHGASSRGGEERFALGDALTAGSESPTTAGMLYLRFASRGAAVSPENTQPFLRDAMAFQHNGALAPRSAAVDALTTQERARLTGTTDSEAYFQHVLRGLASRSTSDALAAAAARMRTLFPAACLNAFAIAGGELFVVHASGTVPPPHEAFAQRGTSASGLPPGHDDSYNLLSHTVSASGAAIVATTGIDQRGWMLLPPDTVTRVFPDAVTSIAL